RRVEILLEVVFRIVPVMLRVLTEVRRSPAGWVEVFPQVYKQVHNAQMSVLCDAPAIRPRGVLGAVRGCGGQVVGGGG
ncbi:MAG: hypothetical protein NUV93_00050, partial [Firmicutes bacterium]|nr:hypothetical protein [Bacillota bacterium]